LAYQIAQGRPRLEREPPFSEPREDGERLSMGQDVQFVVSTAGGYEIRRVWSAEGWLYVLDDSYIGFFSQKEAEDWAREHPKMPTVPRIFPKALG
jgi:hypothetical protein